MSVLAHNKTVLYFGHGGLNGLNEALHYRVPMVAMPVWSDGEDTVNRLVRRGVCVSVPRNSDANTIYSAMAEVLDGDDSEGYRRRVGELADLMGMRRHSPLKDAAWLIEYVAKTKGAGKQPK